MADDLTDAQRQILERARQRAGQAATVASPAAAPPEPGAAPGHSLPPGMVYNPETGQVEDVGARAQAEGRQMPWYGALGAGGVDMMTLGYGDELAGAATGLVAGPQAGEVVTERMRGLTDGAREAHPYAAFSGALIGGAALPIGRVRQGAGWLAGMGRNIVAGIGYGAAYGSGSADEGGRGAGAGYGAVAGGIGGAAAGPLGAAVGAVAAPIANVLRQRQFFANGQVTQAGRDILTRMGVDPDGLEQSLQRRFAADAARAANPEDAAAALPFREFGIPAYRHNITGTVEDAAAFHGAVRGGRGPAAEARVRPAADAQEAARREAAERIATDLSGGLRGDQGDAAVAVVSGLRGAQDAARGAARSAYQDLEAAGGLVGGDAAKGIAGRIAMRVRSAGPLRASLTPQASAALDEIGAAFRPAPGAPPSSIPFMELERVRQSLVKMDRAAKGADSVAMGRVMQAFDEEVEGLITGALIAGDDVIAKAQNARQLWASYATQFKGEGAGSRFIQRMLDEDASPDEAVRWLFGAGKMGGGGFTSTIARQVRDVLGPTSQEWALVRQAAFRQMTMKAEGQVQPGPQQVSEALLGFLNGPATRDLSRTLFTDAERGLMLRYAGVLKRMVPPAGAVNHSGSGYEVARTTRAALQAVLTALTATTQGPVAGMAMQGGQRMVAGAVDRAGTGAMLRPYAGRPSAPPMPGAGVATGNAGLDALPQELRDRMGLGR